MGTTLTAVRFGDDAAYLAHVGDSRAYLMRAGVFRQLTDDHTLVNRMVKAGEISTAEAEVHPHRNVLTRALGTEADVTVDEDEVGLMDGDRLVLCSDGLFAMVTQDQMSAILEAEPDPQTAADRLVRAANRAGGIDNITVLVLDVHGAGQIPAAGGTTSADDAGRGREATRWIAGLCIGLAVLAGAFILGRAYVDAQWYVGVADGNVAVYQGVPAQPLGLSLSHVELQTDLPATEVERIEFYRNLGSGINTNGRDEAYQLVERIRADLAASQKPPKSGAGQGTGGQGSANP
jgi:protein phosphatase